MALDGSEASLGGVQGTKRTPSNRTSPASVAIHRYPSVVWRDGLRSAEQESVADAPRSVGVLRDPHRRIERGHRGPRRRGPTCHETDEEQPRGAAASPCDSPLVRATSDRRSLPYVDAGGLPRKWGVPPRGWCAHRRFLGACSGCSRCFRGAHLALRSWSFVSPSRRHCGLVGRWPALLPPGSPWRGAC